MLGIHFRCKVLAASFLMLCIPCCISRITGAQTCKLNQTDAESYPQSRQIIEPGPRVFPALSYPTTEDFHTTTNPLFQKYYKARRTTEEPLPAGFEDPYEEWQKAVHAYWPHPPYDSGEREQLLQKALDYDEAHKQGKMKREQAIHAWQEVADQFPRTEAAGLALNRAGNLYIQGFTGDAAMNTCEANKLFRRLVDDDFLPTVHTIHAREQLACLPESDEERLNARIELIETLNRWEDVEWLTKNVLPPEKSESAELYLRRIPAFINNLSRAKAITLTGAVYDARGAKNPEAALARLKQSITGQAQLEASFNAEAEKVREWFINDERVKRFKESRDGK